MLSRLISLTGKPNRKSVSLYFSHLCRKIKMKMKLTYMQGKQETEIWVPVWGCPKRGWG